MSFSQLKERFGFSSNLIGRPIREKNLKIEKRLFNMIIEHFAYVLLVQYYSFQILVTAKQHHTDEQKEWGFFVDHSDVGDIIFILVTFQMLMTTNANSAINTACIFGRQNTPPTSNFVENFVNFFSKNFCGSFVVLTFGWAHFEN